MPTVALWQETLFAASSPALKPRREGYDVAVVGGGVIGAAAAHALRRERPSLRVALVEAERLAHGASGRNAGFLLPGAHTDYASAVDAYGRERARRLWAFTEENVAEIASLDGRAFGLRLSGSVLAAGTPAEARRLERAAGLMREDGIAVSHLGVEATNRRVRGAGFRGSLVLPNGGSFHPAQFVAYLAAQAGADVLEGWPVETVEPSAAGVRLEGPAGRLEASAAVLALNAYLPRVWPGGARYVRPVRAQMLATAPVRPLLGMPVYSHEGYYYIRQVADGRLLVGGARHRHAAREVGYADETTAPLQADLLRYLRGHFPSAGVPDVERRWAGIMGFSPDGLPAAGGLPGVPGAFFACGFTGHGMGYALRFGRLLARQVFDETDEAADLFAASRLASAEEPALSVSG